MNSKTFCYMKYLLACLLPVLLSGCATPKTPIYANPQFQPQSVDEIALLPAADGRIDKSIHLSLQKTVRKYVKSALAAKHYRVRLVPAPKTGATSITEEDLRTANPAWIKTLGPADARWVMVVVLDDFRKKFSAWDILWGGSDSAEFSAALFDKEKGMILWRDKGTGIVSQDGGLIGLATIKANEAEVLQLACLDFMRSFPERPKDH